MEPLSSAPDHTRRGLVPLVVILFIALYLLPLGSRPLFEPDETRYAEIPREMIVSGDWVVPRLNGVRYYEKPALGYWTIGASMLLLGENGLGVRLPSALAAGLTALLIALLARKKGANGNKKPVATLAAVVFLTSIEVVGVGTFAVLDAQLCLFLTGTLVALFFALASPRGSNRERALLAAAGLFGGLAFLTKGFLALVVPALTLGGYLLWQGRIRELLRTSWLPLVIATIISLPWSLAIQHRAPDFWNYFFWNEHIRRFLGHDAQHAQPFWFFLVTAPAMVLPWTFLLPAALSGLRGSVLPGAQRSDLVRFSLCWLILPFLFFSACKGKLLTYILPCFPPFAILMAIGLTNYRQLKKGRRFQQGALAAAWLSGILLVALLVFQTTGAFGLRPYHTHWQWFLVASALGGATLLFSHLSRDPERTLPPFLFALALVPFLVSLQFAVPDQTLELKAPVQFLTTHSSEIDRQTIILSDEDPIRATCLAFNRNDVILVGNGGELAYGIGQEKDSHRLITVTQAGEMIRRHEGHIVLVAERQRYKRWEKLLPTPRRLDASGEKGYVFAAY